MSKHARSATRSVYRPAPGAGKLILASQEAGWLTPAEVAQLLGVSDRQVQRYQTTRELKSLAYMKQEGRKPLTLYRLDEVLPIKKALDTAREIGENRHALVVNANTIQRREGSQAQSLAKQANQVKDAVLRLQSFNADFAEILKDREMFQAVVLELLAKPMRPALKDKLLLTIDEAKQLGFLAEVLYQKIRSGELRNFGSAHRFLVSRSDLQAMVNGNGPKVQGSLSKAEKASLAS